MYSTNYGTLFDRMLDWSRSLDEAVRHRGGTTLAETPVRAQLWLPSLDLYETDTAFIVETDLPGVHQENVDIQFDRGTLTITGTRAATLPSKDGEKDQLKVHNAERLSGEFSRSVRLPNHIDAEKIEARFADGVLTVTIPKSRGALPRKIAVRAGEAKAINA